MRTQARDTEVILARDPRQIALQQQTRAAQRLQIRAARAGNQEATCGRLSSAPPAAPGPLAPQAPMPRLHLGRLGAPSTARECALRLLGQLARQAPMPCLHLGRLGLIHLLQRTSATTIARMVRFRDHLRPLTRWALDLLWLIARWDPDLLRLALDQSQLVLS